MRANPKFRMDKEDTLSPTSITHNSEQLWNGDTLEQNYNYPVYEFETEQHLYRARAYLHAIRTVAVYGPFKKDSVKLVRLDGVEIDQRVLAYLRRRYSEIKTLAPTGYVPIE